MKLDHVITQLAENAQLIQHMTANLTAEQAGWQPDPDTWSVMGVIDHLYHEERGDFRARLAVSLGLPDPSEPLEKTPYESNDLAAALRAWLDEREQSLIWLRGLTDPNWQAPCKFEWGQITAGDMVASWAAHDMLHIRQLVELRFAFIVDQAQPYRVDYAGEW